MISSFDGHFQIDVTFKRHATPEELNYAMFPDVPPEDLRKSTCGGDDAEGVMHEWSWDEEIDRIKADGFWGFCDENTRTVHYWENGLVPPRVLIYLLAHEVGHIMNVQEPPKLGPDEDEIVIEEWRADCYGAAAEAAFSHLHELGNRI